MKTNLTDMCHEMGIANLATLRPRWMLVDDNRAALEMLGRMLSFITEAEVCLFDSPTAAVAAFYAEPHRYEMVITDFDMPGMCGPELCHALRSLVANVPVILMTGNDCLSEAEARQEGFNGFLRKPFTLDEFAQSVRNVLARCEQ